MKVTVFFLSLKDVSASSLSALLKVPVLSMICWMGMMGVEARGDWPAYRYDNQRSGVTSESLPGTLALQWIHKPLHAPEAAWPLPGEETPRMHSDRSFHLVVADQTAYFGSPVDNKLIALDVATGLTRWFFYTGGSIRFAPVIDGGRLYFGADDGLVYCLDKDTGREVWRYRPSPSGEKVIGNGRMVSLWPIRTGVVVDQGVVYLAAGVFPYEGLYICAVDAGTGREVWKNDTAGDLAWGLGYGGMAPQGYLLNSSSTLYVPSGRAMPAAFDLKTGEFLRFLSTGGKIGGTWALVNEGQLIAGVNNQGTPAKIAYDDKTGRRLGDAFASFPGRDLVLTPDTSYTVMETGVVAIHRKNYQKAASELPVLAKRRKALAEDISKIRTRQRSLSKEIKDLSAKDDTASRETLTGLEKEMAGLTATLSQHTGELTGLGEQEEALQKARLNWSHTRSDLHTVVLAGDSVVCGGDGFVLVLDAETGAVRSEVKVEGLVMDLAASGGRLFATTEKGPIHCFGEGQITEPPVRSIQIEAQPYAVDELMPVYEQAAREILQTSGIKKGFCLVLNSGRGRLAVELARQSELKIIALESDARLRVQSRERIDRAGLYGSRIVVESWAMEELPDYFANLIVSDLMIVEGRVESDAKEMYRVLRPVGGVALFGSLVTTSRENGFDLGEWLAGSGAVEPTRVERKGAWTQMTRGPLKGAADWAGLYGNPSNTGSTPDELVRGPFGVLWYGEPGSEHMLDRHARSVSPLAINGRLFVQGAELVQAYDAYNGTLLWERKISGAVRVRVDVDGSNLSATDDSLYVATHEKTFRLDAQTGETKNVYSIPSSAGGDFRRWGYIAATDGILYGSAAKPLEHEYAYYWKTLVKDGQWRSKDEIPEEVRKAIYAIKRRNSDQAYVDWLQEQYPVPDKKAYDYFKRAGIHWHAMGKFPGWLPDHQPSAVDDTMMVADAMVAYDSETGELLWKHEGETIPNIAVTLGGGKMFVVQAGLSQEEKEGALKAREAWIDEGTYVAHDEGKLSFEKKDFRRLVALDGKTGREAWSLPVDLSGCGGNKLGTAYADGRLLVFGHYSNHDEGPFAKGNLEWRRISVFDGESGALVWSKPLNYRRRPLVMGETIYIEPRACYLADGSIKMREHPITGKPVPWEFLRPGHSCGIVTASPHSIFYRSFSAAIVNVERDTGLQLFGGMRPGCWNNLIPGNGLLNFQESSAGCTCSYAIRSTVVLKHKPEKEPGEWSVFITKGALTPVAHLALNLGAPGDMRDDEGTMWFGYPRPDTSQGQGSFKNYGVKFDFKEKVLKNMGVRRHDFRKVTIEGSNRPWLFTSAIHGLTECRIPLLDGDETGVYTIRLGFVAGPEDVEGRRVFDVRLQNEVVLENFDIRKEAGRASKAVIREFKDVRVKGELHLALTSKEAAPDESQAPVVHFIEVLRQDEPLKTAAASGTEVRP